MGIEVELFTLGAVAVHYQCMVCKDVPEMDGAALRVMCPAGHIVCSTCVDPLVPRPPKCYLCSQPVISLKYSGGGGDWLKITHPAIERLVKDLEVKCSKHAEGCAWKGRCVELRNHEKTQCEHRIDPCEHAIRGCKVSDLPPKVQAHQAVCEFRDVTCRRFLPWSGSVCGIVHRANLTNSHRSYDCNFHKCEYWKSGCRFSGKLSDVQAHQKSYCAELHAKIAKLEVTVAKEVMMANERRIEKEVSKKVSHLKKRIATLELDLKLAKATASLAKKQSEEGTPRLVGQASKEQFVWNDPETLPPDFTLRFVSMREREESDTSAAEQTDSDEVAWNEAHWTHTDWAEADTQVARQAKKTMSTITANSAGKTNSRIIAGDKRSRSGKMNN